jgi:anti-sigma factor RsiW
VSQDDQARRELHAYHDGELSWWERRRVARRLARDPSARRELEALDRMALLLREEADAVEVPDFWNEVRATLPRRELQPEPEPRRGFPVPPWLGAGLAAAAVAGVLALGLYSGETPTAASSVRWLDVSGHSVMVLQDDVEATVIWMLDSGKESARRDGAFS